MATECGFVQAYRNNRGESRAVARHQGLLKNFAMYNAAQQRAGSVREVDVMHHEQVWGTSSLIHCRARFSGCNADPSYYLLWTLEHHTCQRGGKDLPLSISTKWAQGKHDLSSREVAVSSDVPLNASKILPEGIWQMASATFPHRKRLSIGENRQARREGVPHDSHIPYRTSRHLLPAKHGSSRAVPVPGAMLVLHCEAFSNVLVIFDTFGPIEVDLHDSCVITR